MNSTLMPNGYNMGIGGASNRLARAGKRKREEDNELPKYIRRAENGYWVHHYIKGVSTSFTSKYQTMEEKLDAATAWIGMVEADQQPVAPNRKWKRQEDADLPKYIQAVWREGMFRGYLGIISNQYGKAYFCSEKMSTDEKLEKAKEWVRNALISGPPHKKHYSDTPKFVIWLSSRQAYLVQKPGFPVKTFGRSISTTTERLAKAIDYLESCK